MESKEIKLEIAGFTNMQIKPEPKSGRVIDINAAAERRPNILKSAIGKAGAIRKRLSIKKEGEKEEKTYKTLLVKTAVCACIALTLLFVKNINSPFTNGLANQLKTALNTSTDLEKEIGRLKFVQNIFGSEPVLSEIISSAYVYPVEGKVIKKFGEDGFKGVMIETVMYCPVLSAGEGEVEETGKNENGIPYIKIKAGDNAVINYTGVIARVKNKAEIKKGEILGTLKGNTLTIEVYKDGKAVDPLQYIQESGMNKNLQ